MADANLMGTAPLPMRAGGVIIANTLVKMDSTAGRVVQATAETDTVFGVSLDAAAAAGDPVRVQVYGVASIISNGTCAIGQVECAADGEVTTAGDSGSLSVGVALEAAGADQDMVRVLLALPAVKRPANT